MSNSKDLSRQEEFKRATAGAVRAIARTDDVQVAFQPTLIAGHPEAAGRLHQDRAAGAEAQQEEETVQGARRPLPLPFEGADDALVDLGILAPLDDGP